MGPRPGFVVVSMNWEDFDIREYYDDLKDTFKKFEVEDLLTLATTHFGRGIMATQKHFWDMPWPAWRATHTALITAVTDKYITVVSQEEYLKERRYRRSEFVADCKGEYPRFKVCRTGYEDNTAYMQTMMTEVRASLNPPGNWFKRQVRRLYNVPRILNVLLNVAFQKAGLNIKIKLFLKGLEMCSSRITRYFRAGLRGAEISVNAVFEEIPDGQVAPGHFLWFENNGLTRVDITN